MTLHARWSYSCTQCKMYKQTRCYDLLASDTGIDGALAAGIEDGRGTFHVFALLTRIFWSLHLNMLSTLYIVSTPWGL